MGVSHPSILLQGTVLSATWSVHNKYWSLLVKKKSSKSEFTKIYFSKKIWKIFRKFRKFWKTIGKKNHRIFFHPRKFRKTIGKIPMVPMVSIGKKTHCSCGRQFKSRKRSSDRAGHIINIGLNTWILGVFTASLFLYFWIFYEWCVPSQAHFLKIFYTRAPAGSAR